MSSNPISDRLRQARTQQNYSIEEMSRITKIRPHILEALEAGNFEEFAPIYTKSFLKTYSKALGIPSDLMAQLIESDEKLSQDYYERQTEKRQQHNAEMAKTKAAAIKSYGAKRTIVNLAPRPARKIIFFVLPIVLISGLIFGFFFLRDKVEGVNLDITPISTDTLNLTSDTAKSDTIVKNPSLLDYFTGTESVADSIILEAAVTDSAWISIVMDGQRSEQTILTPNNPRRWSAQKIFKLTLGNAGAVTFTRNGEKLPVLGKKGTVLREVRITADNVTTSATPWQTNPPKQ
ncbi:MAG TPA: RodZ domain-containing protein [Patescibacteria group bacterium]|nr:RodZ domain-containing protein [Patescibacteria group bacterium]